MRPDSQPARGSFHERFVARSSNHSPAPSRHSDNTSTVNGSAAWRFETHASHAKSRARVPSSHGSDRENRHRTQVTHRLAGGGDAKHLRHFPRAGFVRARRTAGDRCLAAVGQECGRALGGAVDCGLRIASQRTYFPFYLRMHWLVIVDFDAIYNPVLPFRAKLHLHGDTNLDAGTNLIVCQGFATPRDISYRFAVTVADGAARLFDDESRAGRIFRDSP